MNNLEKIINEAWAEKENINSNSPNEIINSVNEVLSKLDNGQIRVSEKIT